MTLSATVTPLPTKYTDADGAPLANGKVYTYVAGGSTPKVTYQDALFGAMNTNPVILDADGHADIFLSTGAYDLTVYDENDVLVPTACLEGVVDIAQTQLPLLGNNLSVGRRGLTSGATVLPTETLVTMNGGANPAVLNLDAATRGLPLTIQNIAALPVAITPHGSDTINELGAGVVWTMPAADSAAQYFPSVTLYPDGTSNWRSSGTFTPSLLVTGVAAGVKVASGTATFPAATFVTVSTGLASITSIVGQLVIATPPSTTDAFVLSHRTPSAGTVIFDAWKADGTGVSNSAVMHWIAFGS